MLVFTFLSNFGKTFQIYCKVTASSRRVTLVGFAACKSIIVEQINTYFDMVYEVRGVEKGSLDQFVNFLKDHFSKQTKDEIFNVAS